MRTYSVCSIVALVLVVIGCKGESPIEHLTYDPSTATHASGGSDVTPIDACWLSGSHVSIFVGRLTTEPQVQLSIDHCPDPLYFADWADVSIDVVDVAAGPAPEASDSFQFTGATGLPILQYQKGDEFLLAARYWPDTSAWIIVEAVGVSINSGSGGSGGMATTGATDRPVDLPSDWGDLVSALSQARGSSCEPKQRAGRIDDADFDFWILHLGKDDFSRECSGYMPPPSDDGDPDSTDPREGDL